MRTVLFGLLILTFGVCHSSSLYAQSNNEHVVIQLSDFNSEKNLEVYALFEDDAEIRVVNSCDVLGLVVLEPRPNSSRSANEIRAYSSVKLQEILALDDFVIVEGRSKFDVLVACREEMQRIHDPASK
ncbi:MAG: hypothetical protein HKN45_06410 [Flavobacteriales bacterium]|nr:hypothetical protein [Flavobacteriales bacterium]